MRVLQYFASAWLLSTVVAFNIRRGEKRFVGPPTRDQRLAEGWVDEDAKYFRKLFNPNVTFEHIH